VSVCSFTHVLLQRDRPTPQLASHWPPVHTVPPVHALLHAPQLRLSVAVLVQAFSQRVWLVGHAQLPEPQASPGSHVIPQAPQFPGSLFSLTQSPLHRVCELGQVVEHVPETQACPVWHA
jgi:hypothetical protein